MSRRNLSKTIKLATYEDMFAANEDQAQIIEIAVCELYPFKQHPFKIVKDENMEELIESVKENGILVPIMVRNRIEGGYELISGHRRFYAANQVGLKMMPAMIKICDEDQAIVMMVDANIQREQVSISEKAKAYRMKYDAMKHQGSLGGVSLQEMSDATGESRKTIQRLIYLSNLIDELLDCVESKRIGMMQGVDLSFIGKEQQNIVYQVMIEQNAAVTMHQSSQIKQAVRYGIFSESWLRDLLNTQKSSIRKLIFHKKRLDSYFESSVSNAEIEQTIISLLEDWKAKGGRV